MLHPCDTFNGDAYISTMTTQQHSLERARAGDIDWDAVYAEHLPRVYNYLRFRTGDDTVAEDLTAATFEKAWRGRSRYRRDLAGFGTWLLAIARNVAVDYARRRRNDVPLETLDERPGGALPEEVVERRGDIARLAALLGGLEERERELIALKYGAGLTNRAIAGITGLSESNVGTIVQRGVQRLGAVWEQT